RMARVQRLLRPGRGGYRRDRLDHHQQQQLLAGSGPAAATLRGLAPWIGGPCRHREAPGPDADQPDRPPSDIRQDIARRPAIILAADFCVFGIISEKINKSGTFSQVKALLW